MKKNNFKEQQKSFWNDFKTFMFRGNVLDLAVGVIIGGAFNAIVTALVNILLSVCTWAVPGGLKGLVTVLPAVNDAQAGMNVSIGLGQKFASGDLQSLAKAQAIIDYTEDVVNNNPSLVESVKTTILSKYTLHGTTYFYNGSAIIDWGAFINSIVSFLIIGFTLFIIVKTVKLLMEKNKELAEKAIAELANKKDDKEEEKIEEPVATPAAPVVAASPTSVDVLVEIRDELKKLNENKKAE